MNPIPTERVWYLLGRDQSGNIKHFERIMSHERATERLQELLSIGDKGLEYSIKESEAIIPDRKMPTEQQRRELCDLMHRAFVTLRNLGYAKRHEAVIELADVFHNLPQEMFQPDVWDWNLLEAGLRSFEEKYPEDKLYSFSAMLRNIRSRT